MWIKPRVAEILITDMSPLESIDLDKVDDPVVKELMVHSDEAVPQSVTVMLSTMGDLGVLARPEIKEVGGAVVGQYRKKLLEEAKSLLARFVTVPDDQRENAMPVDLSIISLRVVMQENTVSLGLTIGTAFVEKEFLGVLIFGSEKQNLEVPPEEPFVVLVQDIAKASERAMLSAVVGDNDGTKDK